jgi:predicted nucleic-acid-binding protein
MIGLDTNVLVRFFAQEDPKQSPIADRVLEALTIEDPGWVGLATLLELVWVINSKIGLGRVDVAKILEQLLSRATIVVERADVVEGALHLFRRGSVEFTDCLIAFSAKAAGCSRTVTFDRKAARDTGMELLG